MKMRKSIVALLVLSMIIGLMSFSVYAATVRKVTTSNYTPQQSPHSLHILSDIGFYPSAHV